MSDGQDNELQPLLGDLLGRAVRRLVARGRVELGRAARSSRERLELRQLQRDLDHFWVRLGKTTYRLAEAGELDHPAIRKAMTRIDELEARIDELRTRVPAASVDPEEAPR